MAKRARSTKKHKKSRRQRGGWPWSSNSTGSFWDFLGSKKTPPPSTNAAVEKKDKSDMNLNNQGPDEQGLPPGSDGLPPGSDGQQLGPDGLPQGTNEQAGGKRRKQKKTCKRRSKK